MYGTDLCQLRLMQGSLTLLLTDFLHTDSIKGRLGLGLDAFQRLISRKLSCCCRALLVIILHPIFRHGKRAHLH